MFEVVTAEDGEAGLETVRRQDVSQLSAGRLVLARDEVDLAALVADAVARLRDEAQAVGSPPPWRASRAAAPPSPSRSRWTTRRRSTSVNR